MRELRPGLWHWEAPHPDWLPTEPWSESVSSYAIDDGERLLLFDPLGAALERALSSPYPSTDIPARSLARPIIATRSLSTDGGDQTYPNAGGKTITTITAHTA